MSRSGRRLRLVAQVIMLGGGAAFLLMTARSQWPSLREVSVEPRWPPLIGASLLTLATYAYVVFAWTISLKWWGETLRFRSALRIWSLSNLARFIPGSIWQFAGLATLAVAEGVSPVVLTAAILLQQGVLLAAGLLLSVAFAPGLLMATLNPSGAPQWSSVLPAWTLAILVASGLLLITIGVPAVAPLVNRYGHRLFRGKLLWPAPRRGAFAAFVTAMLLPWINYGVSFWLFSRALLGDAAPEPFFTGLAFISSYLAGIIVVIAPAGIVVREAALLAILGPKIGSQNALLLAVGSRIWLVALELAGALVAIAIQPRNRVEELEDSKSAHLP